MRALDGGQADTWRELASRVYNTEIARIDTSKIIGSGTIYVDNGTVIFLSMKRKMVNNGHEDNIDRPIPPELASQIYQELLADKFEERGLGTKLPVSCPNDEYYEFWKTEGTST